MSKTESLIHLQRKIQFNHHLKLQNHGKIYVYLPQRDAGKINV